MGGGEVYTVPSSLRRQQERRYRGNTAWYYLWSISMLLLVTILLFFSDTASLFSTSSTGTSTVEVKAGAAGPLQNHSLHSHRLSICQALESKSTNALWIQHRIDILEASAIQENEISATIWNRRRIMASITPRLPLSLQTTIRDSTQWEFILRKLIDRYALLDNMIRNDNYDITESMPPSVKIVVLGGSVTRGVRCFLYDERKTATIDKNDTKALDQEFRKCSWVNRLDKLFNQLAWKTLFRQNNVTIDLKSLQQKLPSLVEVSNEAVGATNTEVGNSLLKYKVLPSLQTADILIHAYSTNDVGLGVATENRTYEMLLSLQEFFRSAMSLRQRECASTRAPLLVHINDFLGPMARPILQEPWYPQIVHLLSTYYGIPSASYPAMVNDILIGDPRTSYFSADEYSKGQYGFEIHPGQTFHTAISWMMAYNFLHWTTSFCDLDMWKLHLGEDDASTDDDGGGDYSETDNDAQQGKALGRRNKNLLQYYDDTILRTDFKKRDAFPTSEEVDIQNLYGKIPKHPPSGLPPPLACGLTRDVLHDQWRLSAKEYVMNQQAHSCQRRPQYNCLFQWVAGHDSKKDVAWVQQNLLARINPPSTSSWVFEDDDDWRKMGLTATRAGANMTIKFEYSFEKVKVDLGLPSESVANAATVVLFYMKSYGKKWANSTAKIGISVQGQILESTTLSGFHNQSTSEMYVKEMKMNLPSEVIGQTKSVELELSVALIKGVTFKLMGLILC